MALAAASPDSPRCARHRVVPWLALGLCLAPLLTAAAGCRHAERPPAAGPASTSIAIGLPSPDAPSRPLVTVLTRTRLIRMDQSGHERPGLLERWSVSPDRLAWTFELRAGVHSRDGRPVTAADVASLLERSVTAEESTAGLWHVAGVDAVGPTTIRIRLREPSSLLLESLSLEDVPAGPYRSPADEDDPQPTLEAAGSGGPDAPGIRSVALRRYDTPRAAVAALLREEVDVLYEVPNESRALLEAQDGVRVYLHVKPYVVTLGLNHRHPVLRRRGVRLAMNRLVDREALLRDAAGGVGEPAADLIWLQHWSRPHTADAEALRVDRDGARQLLDAEGLHATRRPDGGSTPRFRIRCLVLDDPVMHRVAARLQRAYGHAGIAMDLESLPLPALAERLGSGRFEAFLSPMVGGYGLSVPYIFFGPHDRPRMIDFGYTAAADAVERARLATTDDAFSAAVADLHRVLLEDPPAVPLYWQRTSRAVGRRVVVPPDPDPGADVLASLPRWTLAREAP